MNLSKIQGGASIELDWKRNVHWKNIGFARTLLVFTGCLACSPTVLSEVRSLSVGPSSRLIVPIRLVA